MITVKFTGGLGNQMFQYAFGRRLSLDQKSELFFDTSWYKKSPDRNFTIENFQIAGKPSTKFEKIKRLFSETIEEKTLLFDTKVLSTNDSLFLNGYWQSPKYFEDIEDILRKDFTLKKPQGEKYDEMLRKITMGNSVSLHVRRGDYLAEKNVSVYTECSPEYYKKAIQYVKEINEDIHLFIFSDDTDWVKENLKIDLPATYVSAEHFTDYQELTLMSACRHNITANSTFSWWGAWLNKNPEKIVITPGKWLVTDSNYENDLLPEEWTKL
ncbi:MAG: alpha-1,2-fucosyltransferase [Candidatus Pacebacteria bacterium]|jgi:hypothetical protein|nr:alpha-1,2-fucosyltransferase [Candidatus Paceibacterota bacterium]